MSTLGRSTVVIGVRNTPAAHTVGVTDRWITGHTVVRAVEFHIFDTIITLDTGGFLEPGLNIFVNFTEDSNLTLQYFLIGTDLHLAGNIVNEAVLSSSVEDLIPQSSWSGEIFGSDLRQEGNGTTLEVTVSLVQVNCPLTKLYWINRTQIVRSSPLIIKCHSTITLEIATFVACARSIDWKLLIVDANTVTVGICIGEETRLQHRVGRWLDSRYQMRWAESNLLDLGEVVDGILVQDKFTDFAERELLLGPNVGQIEDVDLLGLPEIFGFLWCHGLNLNRPLGEVTPLDSLEEIFLRIVGALVGRVLLGNEPGSLLGLHVELTIYPVAILVDQLDGVAIITVHLAVAIWDASVTHEDHDLVDRLWVLRKVIPEHGRIVGVSEVGLRITFLGMDEVREFGRISQEEDGCVIRHDVPVTLIRPHLDGEASWVASTVVGALLATDRRKSNSNWTFLSLRAEDVRDRQIIQRIRALEVSMSATAFGMDDTLWDTLTVEVGEQINQVEILEEERTILAGSLCLVWVGCRDAIAGCVEG